MATPCPNILFLMCDQLRGDVFDDGHPCLTPNLDRLIERGVHIRRAYTANAICSPARASLMTGRLPHSHNVWTVTHVQPPENLRLREELPHWAQHLQQAGYRTGYFGKWHVEHTECPASYGWQVDGSLKSGLYRQAALEAGSRPREWSLSRQASEPPGYNQHVFYGAHTVPPGERCMGIATSLAERFLTQAIRDESPWCCMVSLTEPHDPFTCHRDALAQYDIDSLPIPENWRDPLTDKPGLYRKLARQWSAYSEREVREAAACYYASITEIDACFGRLLNQLEAAGQLEQTIIVLTSDHGELLGSHGLYCKNVGAFEEVYRIPLIMAGPGVASGAATTGRVGIHDIGPTLLELTGSPAMDTAGESRSFAALLRDPAAAEADFRTGLAEYEGGRYVTTQRIYWDGDWKLVHNGFDFDELYNLAEDPYELTNLAELPDYQDKLREMFTAYWTLARESNDWPRVNTHYPAQRFAAYGPLCGDQT